MNRTWSIAAVLVTGVALAGCTKGTENNTLPGKDVSSPAPSAPAAAPADAKTGSAGEAPASTASDQKPAAEGAPAPADNPVAPTGTQVKGDKK